MLSTATIPVNACDLDDLDTNPEWTQGLRALEAFLREVGEDQRSDVVPSLDSRADWIVGDLEVSVLWVYGTPVVELRHRAMSGEQAHARLPLVEPVIDAQPSSGSSVVKQDPLSKDGLWQRLHAITT